MQCKSSLALNLTFLCVSANLSSSLQGIVIRDWCLRRAPDESSLDNLRTSGMLTSYLLSIVISVIH